MSAWRLPGAFAAASWGLFAALLVHAVEASRR